MANEPTSRPRAHSPFSTSGAKEAQLLRRSRLKRERLQQFWAFVLPIVDQRFDGIVVKALRQTLQRTGGPPRSSECLGGNQLSAASSC